MRAWVIQFYKDPVKQNTCQEDLKEGAHDRSEISEKMVYCQEQGRGKVCTQEGGEALTRGVMTSSKTGPLLYRDRVWGQQACGQRMPH